MGSVLFDQYVNGIWVFKGNNRQLLWGYPVRIHNNIDLKYIIDLILTPNDNSK